MKVFDTLTRFSHDADLEVSMNSIFAMGLCGAGTNNARLAQLLRQLASYYSREQDALFITRLAQGLLHLGKGNINYRSWFSIAKFHVEASSIVLHVECRYKAKVYSSIKR